MTSWENPVPIAAFLSLSDLENRSQLDSPNPFFIDDARSRAYDTVCVPLTTAKWKNRWRDMCIISSEPDGERGESAELRAETWRANPAFELGEVTMTRLGMSALSGSGTSADRTYGSEEAEGVIVMISEWLELDASDSWVRHDSEIVGVHCPRDPRPRRIVIAEF